jgi:SAM-dependent methyltransferase
VSRTAWQAAVDELAAAHSRGAIDDGQWFRGLAEIFEAAYLDGDNPRAQSGFGGDEARWEAGRRPITKAIDRDGTFLDVGCASGYLMESIVRWSTHRIEPYGLELAPAIANLARSRLRQWADRIFVGNALTWEPPRRFDFVRTELVYVPESRQQDLLARLLGDVVAPGGRLIVCSYGSPRSGVAADSVGPILRSFGYKPELEYAEEAPEGRGAIVKIACLRA